MSRRALRSPRPEVTRTVPRARFAGFRARSVRACAVGAIAAVALDIIALVATSGIAIAAPNWQASDGPYGGGIRALAVHSASGAIYAGRSADLFRSTDDGATWTQLGATTGLANILDVAVGANGTILVGVSSRGAWWSTNGGATWDNDQITHDPHSGQGATLLTVLVTGNGTMLGGGFRSTNGGNSWVQMGLSGYDYRLDGSGNVLAATQSGVHRSTNHGATWTPINGGIETTAISRIAQGVFVLTDGVWTPYSQGLPTQSGSFLAPRFLRMLDGVLVAGFPGAGTYWNAELDPASTPDGMEGGPSPDGTFPDLCRSFAHRLRGRGLAEPVPRLHGALVPPRPTGPRPHPRARRRRPDRPGRGRRLAHLRWSGTDVRRTDVRPRPERTSRSSSQAGGRKRYASSS